MDTKVIGDTMTVGNRLIKIQLPILKHGYTWALWYNPTEIHVGDKTNITGVSGIGCNCSTLQETKDYAISILKSYIEILENYTEENVIYDNVGRPNF